MRIVCARTYFPDSENYRTWEKLTSVNLSSFSVLMTVLTTPLAAKSRTSMASFLVPTAVLAMVAPLKISFAGKALPMGTGSPSGTPTLGGRLITHSDVVEERSVIIRGTYHTTVPPKRSMSIA